MSWTKSENETVPIWLWAILLIEYVYIFLFLLNYSMAWMHPENFARHAWILENGKDWRVEDFSRFLNVDVLESNANRIGRPLSNFFSVLDAKFRAACWTFLPPHPSFSILWPLLFLGVPFFLFRFFKNMGCHAAVALAGTCFYLSSIGFLAPIVMLFHPGKSLVNLLAVTALCFGSKPEQKRGVIAFFVLMLLAFLSDETGLFVYVMALFLLKDVVLRSRHKTWMIAGFILTPLCYYLVIHSVLPYLHTAVRGQATDFLKFEAFPLTSGLLSLSWKDVFLNGMSLFSDYPHLILNSDVMANPWFFVLHLAYMGAMFLLLALLIATLQHKDLQEGHVKRLWACAALLIIYVFFQTIHLSHNKVHVRIWGVWWYGSLFPLIFYTALTFVMQAVLLGPYSQTFKKIFIPFVLLITCYGLMFSTFRVTIFKTHAFADYRETFKGVPRPQYTPADIFAGRLGPYYKEFSFSKIAQESRCRKAYVVDAWLRIKNQNSSIPPAGCEASLDPLFLAGSQYLLIETQPVSVPNP